MIDYLLPSSFLMSQFMMNEEIRYDQCNAVKEMDVLCGRGKLQNAHPGNQKFRELIRRSRITYGDDRQTKSGRAIIVRSIIDCIHSLGGHFLQWNKKGQYWVEMTDKQRRDKIAHAIRDANKLAIDEDNHHHASTQSLGQVGCHHRQRHHQNNNVIDRSRSLSSEERVADDHRIRSDRLDQLILASSSSNKRCAFTDTTEVISEHRNTLQLSYSHCRYDASTDWCDTKLSDIPYADVNNGGIYDNMMTTTEGKIQYESDHILLRTKSNQRPYNIHCDHVTFPTTDQSCTSSDNDTFLKLIESTLGDIDHNHDYNNLDAFVPYE